MDPAVFLPSFTTPSQAAIKKEDMDLLERAFSQLPENYKQVITLARIMGLSRAEVATEMGSNEGAVRVLLHRALLKLGLLMDQLTRSE